LKEREQIKVMRETIMEEKDKKMYDTFHPNLHFTPFCVNFSYTEMLNEI